MLAPLDDELEAARLAKPGVADQTQLAYHALFESPGPVDIPVRRGLAALAARRHGSAALADHHRDCGADMLLQADELPAEPRLRAAVEHIDLITVSPALVTRRDHELLAGAGWTPDEVVILSQLSAYTSYQVRLLHGFDLLSGRTTPMSTPPPRPTRGNGRVKSQAARAANGGARPTAYTQELLDWTAWVPPVPLDELTPEQKESFAGKNDGAYFRLLSRSPALLKARTAIDKAIFYTRGGLPRAERELAATVASKVNDCVYCASVHARKASHLSKRSDDVQRVLDAVPPRDADWRPTDFASLRGGQDPRWSAIIDFTAALSTTPCTATGGHLRRLRACGVPDEQLVDLIAATAFFAWANRLMLTLGEPFWPGTSPKEEQ
ncbi:peroxidase-related enzyme [Actinomadura verrucosospora]|uniref:Peroxidase-like protein n=1 Tax=Actinomadura verrucosospora TaxID=46165 RepID=A0A7D3ZLR1_ACTVE|nr:peroxidase-related enzyme [Actinomadura verrucosospora]QKG21563.1 peroxidase-like protein [Actinomadura verrucosospora]